MATKEISDNLEYCDSSSESDKEESCEPILGRLISVHRAAVLLRIAKDKKVLKLRCLKDHQRQRIPSDSTLEHVRDPTSAENMCTDEEKDGSDTVSEIKSSSSVGTSLHQSISKPNLSVFDFSEDAPNNPSFSALSGLIDGSNHKKKHHPTVQETKSKTPKSQDRMATLLSSVMKEDQMERAYLSESPLASPPPRPPPQSHSNSKSQFWSPPSDGVVVSTAAASTGCSSLVAPGDNKDCRAPVLSQLVPGSENSGDECSPLLNGAVDDISANICTFKVPFFKFGTDVSNEPMSPSGMNDVKKGLSSQLTSVERFLEDDSIS